SVAVGLAVTVGVTVAVATTTRVIAALVGTTNGTSVGTSPAHPTAITATNTANTKHIFRMNMIRTDYISPTDQVLPHKRFSPPLLKSEFCFSGEGVGG